MPKKRPSTACRYPDFSSTEQEIRELQETLEKYGPKHTEILPLYARLGLSEQQKILRREIKAVELSFRPTLPKPR